MIRNYIKIAYRNLTRDWAFSILNLVGLAIGLASVIMIMGYVRYELSYDKSYSNHTRVYRLLEENKKGTSEELMSGTQVGLAPILANEFPAIRNYSIVSPADLQFKYNTDIVNVKIIAASADFFKIFNFPFIQGNAQTALNEPHSIVLTEKIARQFFGDKNPIGKYITDHTGKVRHITGVIKDIPDNTHFTGDAIVSLADQAFTKEALNWHAFTSMPHYFLLNEHTDYKKLEASFSSIYNKYKFPPGITIRLQPVIDIHLLSGGVDDELWKNGDIKYIYIFSSIALLILIIASINYINLATARSLRRAGEIGVRKVLGALRRQLIMQFLTESFLFFFCSTILAVFISYILWPVFSAKITVNQQVLPLFDAELTGFIVIISVIGGLLSGAYPALFLSSIQPVKILNGLSKFGVNISIRKALVVLQFAIAGVLSISTIVVNQQLNYINNSQLGFNKNNLLVVPFNVKKSHVMAFKNELVKNSDIRSASVASWKIGNYYGSSSSMPDKNDTTKQLYFQSVDADQDFIKTMGIHLLSGRNFSADYSNDMLSLGSIIRKKMSSEGFMTTLSSKSIILNQEAVTVLGLKTPEGANIKTGAVQGTVIGVVQNFNGLSMHDKVGAVIIRCDENKDAGQMYIRVSSFNTKRTIAYIENKWKAFYPDDRFDFAFADDKLQQLYTADSRLGNIFGIFASLAIVIACLGLFGLISLTVQNRVKEIGIRKVLGASVFDIANLISVDFLKLVLLSFLISSPIAWYFMNKWLEDFAYRVDIHWWVFLLACGIALIISVITLSFQSIKAAIANPVDSLRSE
jgi:putative ABC transport system permease protein